MDKINQKDYQLCYVHHNKAYFTKDDIGFDWWEDWIDSPALRREGLRHYNETANVTALYFEVADKNIRYGEPEYATFENSNRLPWFSYKTIAINRGKQCEKTVDIFSGMLMAEFIETILNDGGLVYELKEGGE